MNDGHSVAHYEQRLNHVLDYIEANFDRDLALANLADIAHFSPFHFHRLFKAYTGEAPHAFVRRLRLQKALGLIERRPRRTLASIAHDCGFAQSSDFSRAFREAYGYPPSQHRAGRIAEESKIRQDMLENLGYGFRGPNKASAEDQFQVRVEDQPERRIAYIRVIGGHQPQRLMAALNRLLDWGKRMGIYPGATLIASSPDNPDLVPANRYRTDLAMVLPAGTRESGSISFASLPARRYAMLHCRGDIHKVDRAWSHLFGLWLPASGLEPVDAPCLEIFRNSDDANGWATLDLDCCVPVRPLAYDSGLPR